MAQVFRVERNKNFTVMSNHHFKNKDLSLKATVHIAAGLPFTWHFSVQGKAPVELFIAVATQKEDFQKYLLQKKFSIS